MKVAYTMERLVYIKQTLLGESSLRSTTFTLPLPNRPCRNEDGTRLDGTGPVATVDFWVPRTWEYASHRLGLSVHTRISIMFSSSMLEKNIIP
jgi:hypothetical protein